MMMTFKKCLAISSLAVALVGADTPGQVRFATFNASLNRDKQGALLADLARGDDPQIKNVAEILQRIRPDIILINEFDYDGEGSGPKLFQEKYLAVSQNEAKPLTYPYVYAPKVNTGLPSGQDLDNNGKVESEPGSRGYGNDSFGFGQFPGQYGFVLFSKFPIETSLIKTFEEILWKDQPEALLPTKPDGTPWYTPEALKVLRLSSKNHTDVPVTVGKTTIHLLLSHPTPPAFDGPEKRNAKRNHDEIRLWADFLTGGDTASYLGKTTAPRTFVVLGDLNSDPNDGGGVPGSIDQLLKHSLVNATFIPKSEGGTEAAKLQKGKNTVHKSNPAHDTADFNENIGNLRADYVLPSKDLQVLDGGIFWPVEADPLARLVAMTPKVVSSDHRLVYLDLKLPATVSILPSKVAKAHVGAVGTFAMTVKSTKKALPASAYYLDSEDDFRDENDLALVIPFDSEPLFEAVGIKDILEHYRGKKIEVTGEVVSEKNQTRIHITKPEQIKILDAP